MKRKPAAAKCKQNDKTRTDRQGRTQKTPSGFDGVFISKQC